MSDSDNGRKKMSLGNTEQERRNNLIVIFLAAILLVVTVLFFVQRSEHSKIMVSLNAEKDSLRAELSHMIQGYDSLKTDNDTLNAHMFAARTKVEDLMLEIDQVKKASYEQINKYQNEVGSLRRIMRNYIVQVDSLNRRNQQLIAENEQVRRNYMEIESQNKALQEEKQQLSQRIEKAAMLETQNLTVAAINRRGNEVNNRERAEKLRISFTLGKNVTARRGNKNIYVRILRPDQVLLTKSPDDLFRYEDLRIQYSAAREVNYEGNDLPVNIFWDNTGEDTFMVGTYTVDVFADGNNIGTTTFSFRR